MNKIPELAIGMIDGVWQVAMADQHGWVETGSGEPLADDVVATWTRLEPATSREVDVFGHNGQFLFVGNAVRTERDGTVVHPLSAGASS